MTVTKRGGWTLEEPPTAKSPPNFEISLPPRETTFTLLDCLPRSFANEAILDATHAGVLVLDGVWI